MSNSLVGPSFFFYGAVFSQFPYPKTSPAIIFHLYESNIAVHAYEKSTLVVMTQFGHGAFSLVDVSYSNLSRVNQLICLFCNVNQCLGAKSTV